MMYDAMVVDATGGREKHVKGPKMWRPKSDPEAKVNHGDIILFSAPPQHELAFAFVFREVVRSTTLLNGGGAKRKAEEDVVENKRIKGIGIGAPAGPIYLDDFRSLQRSNTELRKQLEGQVLTVNTLRNEHRATVDRHENELKELKENVTNLYLDQVKELQHIIDAKQKELLEVNRTSAEQKNVLEEINERLSASKQSCIEANEIMKSQKASIAELEAQVEEERDQRRDERQKAAIETKFYYISVMIRIVAPDLKEQFGVAKDDDSMGREGKQGSTSNSDTESCTKSGDQDGACAAKGGSNSDAETECSDEQEDLKNGVAMDEDSESTQEDSLG